MFFCWCSLAPQDMKQNGLQPWLAWKLELLFVCFVGWWVWCQCLLLVMIGFFQKPMRCLWRCLKQVVFLNLLTEQGLKVVVNMEHSCRSNRNIYLSKTYSFHPAFQKRPRKWATATAPLDTLCDIGLREHHGAFAFCPWYLILFRILLFKYSRDI